jgi:hypothetical protein
MTCVTSQYDGMPTQEFQAWVIVARTRAGDLWFADRMSFKKLPMPFG